MNVPQKVEAKIRHLIDKFPHTEWSGILFYTYSGNFEDKSLTITCEDLLLMDIGTAGWTDFHMTPDVAAYIAQNPELFTTEIGLIHSHHDLTAFFSGQDIQRLREDGNDTNCFVSLVVDTRGTYVAAITRKIRKQKEIKNFGSSYEFFGKGRVSVGEASETQIVSEDVVEYFSLEVNREIVPNKFSELDSRIAEIAALKQKPVTPSLPVTTKGNDHDFDFSEYRKQKKEERIQQPTLWTDEEMGTIEQSVNSEDIELMATKLITCDLLTETMHNLKQWVDEVMDTAYTEFFQASNDFDAWVSFIIPYLLDNYCNCNPFYEEKDIAQALYNKLYTLPQNEWIEQYMMELTNYFEDYE